MKQVFSFIFTIFIGTAIIFLLSRLSPVNLINFFLFIPQSVMGSLNPTSKIKNIFEETIKAHNNISKEEAQDLIEKVFEDMRLS